MTNYKQITAHLKKDPVGESYKTLDALIETKDPLFGHRKAVAQILGKLNEVYKNTQNTSELRAYKTDLREQHRAAPSEELQDLLDTTDQYIASVRHLCDFSHGLKSAVEMAIFHGYLEQRQQEFFDQTMEISKNISGRNLLNNRKLKRATKLIKKRSYNFERFDEDVQRDLPKLANYKVIMPKVLDVVREEYMSFRADPVGHGKKRMERIEEEMKSFLEETNGATTH